MAKVPYSKLDCKVDTSTSHIDVNGQEISIKNYLPVQEKLEMVGNIINQAAAADTNGYWNPGKINVFFALEVIQNYTNISFTDKQKENPAKLYDALVSSGAYHNILQMIDSAELNFINNTLNETLRNLYTYKNSIYGILDTISTDYSNLELDAEKLRKEIGDPNNIDLLRKVVAKLG